MKIYEVDFSELGAEVSNAQYAQLDLPPSSESRMFGVAYFPSLAKAKSFAVGKIRQAKPHFGVKSWKEVSYDLTVAISALETKHISTRNLVLALTNSMFGEIEGNWAQSVTPILMWTPQSRWEEVDGKE